MRSASEVSKLGEDPVQGLLPVGCVSVGGCSNWRDLLGRGGRGWNWGCYGNPEGVLPGRRRCCVWGTEGSGTATAPGAQGRGELGCPQTVTVLRVLTPATCARGYGALRSKPQPVRWGHSGDAYEPLQVAPRLQLSPGGGCQGGDLRAQKADSEDILEQMSIPDSTSLP